MSCSMDVSNVQRSMDRRAGILTSWIWVCAMGLEGCSVAIESPGR